MTDSSIIDEIKQAIDNIDYGSVEVIVQDHEVTQISTRIIKKTKSIVKKEHENGRSNVRRPVLAT